MLTALQVFPLLSAWAPVALQVTEVQLSSALLFFDKVSAPATSPSARPAPPTAVAAIPRLRSDEPPSADDPAAAGVPLLTARLTGEGDTAVAGATVGSGATATATAAVSASGPAARVTCSRAASASFTSRWASAWPAARTTSTCTPGSSGTVCPAAPACRSGARSTGAPSRSSEASAGSEGAACIVNRAMRRSIAAACLVE